MMSGRESGGLEGLGNSLGRRLVRASICAVW